jgi:Bacterial protein of unknown function (Gcw_chp)
MKAMSRLRATALSILLVGFARVTHAQTEVGAQLDLFSAYVWRGVSLTNKPVAEPDVYVSFPAGNASITVGGWANIDLGEYDDIDGDDISQSGGVGAFNLSEFDPYAEVSFPAGKATLTGGVVGYIYPNDEPGATSDGNTVELYAIAGFDVPLAPELAVYYDIDEVNGAYFEGAVAHSVPLNERLSLDLGALVGVNAGQDFDPESDDIPNFEDNGFTHLDFSAGLPLAAGAVSIIPVLHFQVGIDEATKFAGPNDPDSDVKLWGGVSIGWSNAVEEEEEAAEEE